MTQLLISVKNLEESQLAMYAGTNIIDLKDPSVGALGALAINEVKKVLAALDGDVLTSATVGEGHSSLEALIADIEQYARIGVGIVKISISEQLLNQQFILEMQQITLKGIKLVAVFFADTSINLADIKKLQTAGFYGAMLDTQNKNQSLMDVQPMHVLQKFIQTCKLHGLISGVAGSVRLQHLNTVITIDPDFIGMRGGVCDAGNRMANLSQKKVEAANALLLKYNIENGFGSHSLATSLQI